jgi:predicted ester cyclase
MTSSIDGKTLCTLSLHMMASGDLGDFQAIYSPDAHNREAFTEPAEARGAGPAAFYATALWLRSAFSQLAWTVHDVVQDGELVVAYTTMSGLQSGPFITYGPDARPAMVFPPRRRTLEVSQTHWWKVDSGKIVDHWANRDDLGMGEQLGWSPPSPAYLARMYWARHRARQAMRT